MSNIWLTAYQLSLWILKKQTAGLNLSCTYFKNSVKTPVWITITVQLCKPFILGIHKIVHVRSKNLQQLCSVLCRIGDFRDYQLTLICTVPRGIECHPCLKCSCNIIDKTCTNQAISWAISWFLVTDTLK